MDEHKSKETEWKWRYSIWTGVMYGPIPVGIIAAVIVALFFAVYQLSD
jgi:hypothetical protein